MTAFESRPVSDDEISGEEKLRRVAKLVQELRADLKELNFLPHERNAAMEQLKVFGRNATNADPIFTKEGIEILTQHSFHTTSPTTSRAALQCLANALLSAAPTRQIFVDSGYSPRAVARLKNPKKDDEFLMSRILFLTSYGASQDFLTLIDKFHLADYINDNIARHAKAHGRSAPKKPPSAHEDLALSETLKLLFNVTHFCPQRIRNFQKSIPQILKIISYRTISLPPIKQPVNYLINALVNLDLEEKKALPSKSELKAALERLTMILDRAMDAYTESELEGALIPLLTLLKRVAKAAPADVRIYMKQALVPLPSINQKLPNARTSRPVLNPDLLPHKLLQHTTTPVSTQIHDAISALFFELADQDANGLISAFGIGFPSGFLVSRNLQMPSSPSYEGSIRSLNTISDAGSRSSASSQEPMSGHGSPLASSPVTEMVPQFPCQAVTVQSRSSKPSLPRTPVMRGKTDSQTKREAELATEKLSRFLNEKVSVRHSEIIEDVDVMGTITKDMSEMTVVVLDEHLQNVNSKGQ